MKNKIILVLLIGILVSCSENDGLNVKNINLYESEKVNFTEIVYNKIGIEQRSSEDFDDYIHTEFETSFNIPQDISNMDLDNYILDNLNSISGNLKYLINDEEFISVEIVNGEIVNFNRTNVLFRQSYPCTYDGIQDCVQDIVYTQWSTFKKIKCAVQMGLPCIAEETGNCISNNCF